MRRGDRPLRHLVGIGTRCERSAATTRRTEAAIRSDDGGPAAPNRRARAATRTTKGSDDGGATRYGRRRGPVSGSARAVRRLADRAIAVPGAASVAADV